MLNRFSVVMGTVLLTTSLVHAGDVVQVNGTPISDELVALLGESRAQGPLSGMGQDTSLLVEDLITTELLAQAAKAQGVDKVARHRMELELAHKTLLSQFYVMDFIDRLNISEQELRAAYDAVPEQIMVQMAYWEFESAEAARAFLSAQQQAAADVNTNDQNAENIEPWQSIDAFAFSALARTQNIQSGEWLREVIEQNGRWLVWRCMDRSTIAKPAFEVAKEGIRQELSQQRLQSHIAALKEQASIRYSSE
ncbi:MAG: hypothetical protein R3183_09290 [Oleiphilaceae bacterium]|nr:hypothetical protein [Oleiphilaceae bacterium]